MIFLDKPEQRAYIRNNKGLKVQQIMETILQEKSDIKVPDDFYDNCLMEADGKGTFLFFDDDLTVPMTGVKKPGNWNDKWTFSDHTSFDVDPELYDVDLDRLILRGYFLEEQQMAG